MRNEVTNLGEINAQFSIHYLEINLLKKIFVLFVVIVLCIPASDIKKAYAKSPALQEYQVKAAFLYNFAKFIEWPAEAFKDANNFLIIGIIGRDPFGDALDVLEQKSIAGRKILIRRFASVEDLQRCHILFISNSEKENLPNIFKAIRKWHVLTVGEMKGFPQSGGMVNFILVDNKIQFEINVDAAQQANLRISSQLLKLARIVKAKT